MFFCRHPEALDRTFAVDHVYVTDTPAGVVDPYVATMQWSRRFIGLKVLVALAERGLDGYAAQVDHQTAMGDLLRQRLCADGWELRNATPLPLVCFTHPAIEAGRATANEVATALQTSGEAWMSVIRLPGRGACLRACICSYRTMPADIDRAVAALGRALDGVVAP